MFLRAIAATLLALLSLPVSAQCTGESYLDHLSASQRVDLDAAVADMPFATGLTWQGRKDGRSILVVGTMHIHDTRLGAIRDRVLGAVQSADLILLEATPAEEAKLQNLVVTDPGRLFIVDGPTLPDLLDAETWELVMDAATGRGIPSFMAAKMQPWYLSMMLSIPQCAMQDMIAGGSGLDKMIMQDATAAGVPMQALEPFTTLFDIFQADPIEEQIDMMRLSLLAPDQQQKMFVAMLDRYFAEDVGRLWEMSRIAIEDVPGVDLAEAAAVFAETEQALLIDRNRNWMPVIRAATDKHAQIVVAVGAAHLIGSDGVLQLLQDDGWQLNRVH